MCYRYSCIVFVLITVSTLSCMYICVSYAWEPKQRLVLGTGLGAGTMPPDRWFQGVHYSTSGVGRCVSHTLKLLVKTNENIWGPKNKGA